MGLASTFISDLMEILQVWEQGQRSKVEKFIKQQEKAGGAGERIYFHWLSGRKDMDDVIEIHKRIRRLVREEAGKLG
jgi:predicted HAD superfamily phosphohydrolase